jgi:hypothetical protein
MRESIDICLTNSLQENYFSVIELHFLTYIPLLKIEYLVFLYNPAKCKTDMHYKMFLQSTDSLPLFFSRRNSKKSLPTISISPFVID